MSLPTDAAQRLLGEYKISYNRSMVNASRGDLIPQDYIVERMSRMLLMAERLCADEFAATALARHVGCIDADLDLAMENQQAGGTIH